MARLVRNWTPEPVADAAVKPYSDNFGDHRHDDYEGFVAGLDYKAGDVIWMERNGEPTKARIVDFFIKRNSDGFPITRFRVQYATAKGLWSKNWEHTWPGYVERGYTKAMLAETLAKKVSA